MSETAAAFLKSWEWERTRSRVILGLEEVWLMVGINTQASTMRRPTMNKTMNKQRRGDGKPADTEGRNQSRRVTDGWPNGQRRGRGVPQTPLAQRSIAHLPALFWASICLDTKYRNQRKTYRSAKSSRIKLPETGGVLLELCISLYRPPKC